MYLCGVNQAQQSTSAKIGKTTQTSTPVKGFGLFQTETNHQGQMIAETRLVARTSITTAGLHATISLVGLKKERSIEDACVMQSAGEGSRSEDMIEHVPFTLEAIGGFSTIPPTSLGGDFGHRRALQLLEAGCVTEIVEIACHNHPRTWTRRTNGID